MLLPNGIVIALVDGEKFELYRNVGTEPDPKLEALPVPDLEATNYSAGVHEHDKVSRLALGGPKGIERSLDEKAHAAAVVEWLNQQALQNAFERLVIVADPSSLGEMRRHYHKKLEAVLACDLDRTLTGAPADKIVKALHSA